MSITKEKKIVVPSGLGNATPATVRKGVTFTSDSGINQIGVAEAETTDPVLQEKTATENGEVTADSGYDGLSKVTVAVPAPEITTEEVTATPTKEKQEITPTNADYISKAIVNPIPSEYVVPSGTVNISSNGTHDVSGKATAEVNVPIPDGYVVPAGTVNINANGEHDVSGKQKAIVNVPIPDGYVPEGTVPDGYVPEGTVPDGYVKPEGSMNITENGSHDVSGKATAVVNVPIPDGYIKPSGTKTVTTNGTHDVKAYESVSVNVPTEGGGGDCTRPHVIEVDELPAENIDENAVYFCDKKYHKYKEEFNDLIVYQGSSPTSYKEFAAAVGMSINFYIIPTKTTDGVISSTDTELHVYYIKDEDDVFIYQNDTWGAMSESGDMAYGGAISDISEATDEDCYYILGGTGWKEYLAPAGSSTFTENGKYDVVNVKTAVVAIPDRPISYLIPRTIEELPIDAPAGSMAIVFRG